MERVLKRRTYSDPRDLRGGVEAEAKRRLMEERPRNFYYRDVECTFDAGVLRVQGRVPTYYLKQLLQARLMSIEGVAVLENNVEVISSVGLSSSR